MPEGEYLVPIGEGSGERADLGQQRVHRGALALQNHDQRGGQLVDLFRLQALEQRGGIPFSPSWELLEESRDARSDALTQNE